MPKKTVKAPSRFVLSLFISGLIVLTIPISWNMYQGSVLSFTTLPQTIEPNTQPSIPPVKIRIPRFSIDLPIEEAQIKNGIWQINSKGASHLAISANPGDKGNIILYGHNKKNLFGKARGLKIGDEIDIISKDGKEFIYKITETKIVAPTDISVVAPTTGEVLTFYTCTGFLDTKRFVVKARPVN